MSSRASFLVKNVRVFDGEKSIENSSVLVENGRISKISTDSIDYDGVTFAEPGHTLIPGLIDAHIHADGGTEVALPQCLRFGVTTACDMHNEPYNIDKLRKQVEGGDCADIKTTGFAATIDMGWPMPVVLAHDKSEKTLEEISTWPKLVTPADGRQYVQDRVKENVDYIKLMYESGTFMGQQFKVPSIELQKAVIDEAHKHGLKAVCHCTSLADTIAMLEAGVDGLTHTFIDRPPTAEVIELYKRNQAHCNPTLATMGSATAEGQAAQEKLAHDPRVQKLLGEEERQRMCMCMAFAKETGGKCEYAYETVRQLKKAGVDVICGSDAAGPAVGTAWGLSVHQEMALLVNECDFTPAEALRSATYLPAKRFDFSDRGQIKEGLRADLVLVEGDPLEDIDHTLNLRAVWKAGKLCSSYEGRL